MSGAWFGSMMPPAPSRIVAVCAPTCAISTLVADDAIAGMLWCSAYQTRSYPSSSARWASATLAAKLSPAVWPRPIGARSRIDNRVCTAPVSLPPHSSCAAQHPPEPTPQPLRLFRTPVHGPTDDAAPPARQAPHVRRSTATVLVTALAAGAYVGLLRRRILEWGATRDEAVARLPGDELLERADGASTRAIDVAAPPGAVWPWIAQMGPAPRGGAYTYDWIENLLGLDMHSADHVLPEHQHPRVGETIVFGPNRMRLERVKRERVLAWRSEDGNWVWTFVLEPRDGSTRLISRNRFRLPTLGARLGMLPLEPASLLMERKMLRGIKQRAERLAAERPPTGTSAA